MPDALVLAIGNPLRRDDGAAAAAVDGLGDDRGVAVVVRHQLAPELADAVAAARMVAIVDARQGGAPGSIAWRELRAADAAPPALAHALSPEALLALAAALHGARPPAWLVTVAGADFSFGEGLSPPVERALPELRARVAALLRFHCS